MGGRLLHSDRFQIYRHPLFFIIIWLVNNDIVVLLSAVDIDALVVCTLLLFVVVVVVEIQNLNGPKPHVNQIHSQYF